MSASFAELPSVSSSAHLPQDTLIVRLVLEAAVTDRNLQAALVTNAGQVFSNCGYPLQSYQFEEFNTFVRKTLNLPRVLQQISHGKPLEEIDDIGCIICQVGCYAVAAIITAVGAVGVSFLTAGSAPVVALAGWAGISAVASLALIKGMIAAIGVGITAVVLHICQWAGACS
jgi:hypothetical protein